MSSNYWNYNIARYFHLAADTNALMIGQNDLAYTLLQGLAKGDKPEQVLRAAVALGASTVTFVRTERSVAGAELRRERLHAVMVDAARQCGALAHQFRGDAER